MPKRKASSNGYVSKGQRPNVRKDIRKATRREYREDLLRVSLIKMEAWNVAFFCGNLSFLYESG